VSGVQRAEGTGEVTDRVVPGREVTGQPAGARQPGMARRTGKPGVARRARRAGQVRAARVTGADVAGQPGVAGHGLGADRGDATDHAARDAAEAAGGGEREVAGGAGQLRGDELDLVGDAVPVGTQRAGAERGQAAGQPGHVRGCVVGDERDDVADVGGGDVVQARVPQRAVGVEVERRPRIGVAEQVDDEVVQRERWSHGSSSVCGRCRCRPYGA